MPVQATMSRVFTKNDQYGIFSPQVKTQTAVTRSSVRGLPEAMTRTALRQVREQNRGIPPVEGQYVHYSNNQT